LLQAHVNVGRIAWQGEYVVREALEEVAPELTILRASACCMSMGKACVKVR